MTHDEQSLHARVDATLAAFARVNPSLLAALPEFDRDVRLHRDVDALLARWPDPQVRPPLFGTLVGIKDVLNVDGLPTRAGSALPAEAFAGSEAGVVGLLRAAGALIFGKLTSTEFAYFDPGPTANPHLHTHTPGGSSSGSAAAVGAGLLALAVGTQTVGSVIRPAAYCGVVGFKPSYGRLPVDGLLHFSPSIDTIGLFTRDVAAMRGAAAALLQNFNDAAAAADDDDEAAPAALRLAIPDDAFLALAARSARGRFERVLRELGAAGVELVRLPLLADHAQIARRHTELVQREFATVHKTLFARWGAFYRPVAANTCRAGVQVSDADYAAALASADELQRLLDRALKDNGCAAWATPAAPGPAPLGLHATGRPTMNLPFSHARVPALTLPCDWVRSGGGVLPLGLQLAGARNGDAALLRVAATIEALLPGRGWRAPTALA